MTRETLGALDALNEQALAARLARVERAYEDLLKRVHRYERERAEIRARLERLLTRLAPPGPFRP